MSNYLSPTKSSGSNQTERSSRRQTLDLMWNRNYAALLEYGKERGTYNVLSHEHYDCKLEGFLVNGTPDTYTGRLGAWVNSQRLAYRKGRLRHDREAKLQSLVKRGMLADL
jgi:hypothetical protein